MSDEINRISEFGKIIFRGQIAYIKTGGLYPWDITVLERAGFDINGIRYAANDSNIPSEISHYVLYNHFGIMVTKVKIVYPNQEQRFGSLKLTKEEIKLIQYVTGGVDGQPANPTYTIVEMIREMNV